MAQVVVEILIDAVRVCHFLTLMIKSMIAENPVCLFGWFWIMIGSEQEVRLKVFKRVKHIFESKRRAWQCNAWLDQMKPVSRSTPVLIHWSWHSNWQWPQVQVLEWLQWHCWQMTWSGQHPHKSCLQITRKTARLKLAFWPQASCRMGSLALPFVSCHRWSSGYLLGGKLTESYYQRCQHCQRPLLYSAK